MTDQEINNVIAIACGWKYHHWSHHQMPYWEDPQGRTMGIPDYCKDLNEMAKAEKDGLSGPIEKAQYYHELAKLRKPGLSVRHQIELPMICATAPQRAEAFLRAKGLWT
jgi:hypothetical protein